MSTQTLTKEEGRRRDNILDIVTNNFPELIKDTNKF